MSKEPTCVIDFETRSACSLRKSGAYRYSVDPTTEVLCMAYRLPSWTSGRVELWHPAFPMQGMLEDLSPALYLLFDHIAQGGLIEAHNAQFERCIWANIMVARYDWPCVGNNQWRCSAAKAASHALPRSLDDALAAIGSSLRKDAAGAKVMMKMTKPRKPRKAEREAGVTGLLWWETPELLEQLFAYCRQDVLAEQELSEAIPDLSPAETQMYLLDQTINARGFQLDMEAVETALRLIARETRVLNKELSVLTGGQVAKATQRAQMLTWFASEGLHLENTQKAILDDLSLDVTISPPVQRAIQLVRALGRSSTAKYKTMESWAGRDGRVRGGLLYHGASTGRWSGAGVQLQNLPKGTQKVNQEELWACLKKGLREDIVERYRSPMEAVSNGLRGAIVASPGHQLFVADYASIEARVVLWLAGDEEALDIFRSGRDIYCEMAKEIYGRPITKDDKDERALGKIAILGLGYQMGAAKFTATCASFGIDITEDFAKEVVNAYRSKFWRVKQLWSDQEEMAIAADTDGEHWIAGHVTWLREGEFLYAVLPSGRRLAYPYPQIRQKETPWGEMRNQLTFMGINSLNRKWQRQHSYGGSLVENLTQSVARDLLAAALLHCEMSGTYVPVAHIHDEIICEAPDGCGDVAEFTRLIERVPSWAHGCPVEADSWTGFRYRKG